MQFQNKNRVSYLAAWALILSYAELLIPRFVPFFRLGLANVVILLALDLNMLDFFALTALKSVTGCIASGTLFSPFAIISLGQSLASGFAMLLFSRLVPGKGLSVYGLSMTGSAVSAAVQILLSSLYIGKGTFSLLGPMLIFSVVSALVTAFLSQTLNIPDEIPPLTTEEAESDLQADNASRQRKKNLVIIILILVLSILIMMIKNLAFLISAFFVSLAAQLMSGRKIKIMPHIWLWLFVIITSLLVKNGRVIFSISIFSVTQGSLIMGVTRSLRLSSVMALSQCATALNLRGNSLVAQTFLYFKQLRKSFDNGNLRKILQKL